MSEIQPIVIVVACDNHYMPLFAALMKSIEVNHKTGEHILFFILDDGVLKKNKLKLEKSVSSDVFTLFWIPKDRVIPEGMSIPYDHSSYPLIVHMRMFIPYFVPEKYEKVLYMDVDMIVTDDISKLWYTGMEDCVVAAVIDVRIKESGNLHAVENYRE